MTPEPKKDPKRGFLFMDVMLILSRCAHCDNTAKTLIMWSSTANRCKHTCTKCLGDTHFVYSDGGSLPGDRKGWEIDENPKPLLEPYWDPNIANSYLVHFEGRRR